MVVYTNVSLPLIKNKEILTKVASFCGSQLNHSGKPIVVGGKN